MKTFCPAGCHYKIQKSVYLTNCSQYTKGLCVLVSMAKLTLYGQTCDPEYLNWRGVF